MRRKPFDPSSVPIAFWARPDVQVCLANRDAGGLFGLYLQAFPGCTQTQLALLTAHDRSDISNWVRRVRVGTVSDIGVLTRIADGLRMPDRARVLLGIAPADLIISAVNAVPGPRKSDKPSSSQLRMSLCGSRARDTNPANIDAAVRALARMVLTRNLAVVHGPLGVGIEVMTYVADHYRPPEFDTVIGVFGRRNIVKDADLVIVVGGGEGTQHEVDLALAMDRCVIALAPTGGTAQRFHQLACRDRTLRSWMTDDQFSGFDACRDVEDGVRYVEYLLTLMESGA